MLLEQSRSPKVLWRKRGENASVCCNLDTVTKILDKAGSDRPDVGSPRQIARGSAHAGRHKIFTLGKNRRRTYDGRSLIFLHQGPSNTPSLSRHSNGDRERLDGRQTQWM